jgi:hypothetical protein
MIDPEEVEAAEEEEEEEEEIEDAEPVKAEEEDEDEIEADPLTDQDVEMVDSLAEVVEAGHNETTYHQHPHPHQLLHPKGCPHG